MKANDSLNLRPFPADLRLRLKLYALKSGKFMPDVAAEAIAEYLDKMDER